MYNADQWLATGDSLMVDTQTISGKTMKEYLKYSHLVFNEGDTSKMRETL